jgi:hypothetical protein
MKVGSWYEGESRDAKSDEELEVGRKVELQECDIR